ncbi:hypothetical protein [Nostoc sp. JL23]|uniref:hypothetical protein n=1 Tax=Nostoc sp. JL23 TaxID=2815394 RepID=UPI001D69C269|nr:hypothetical protein [Nostoc sp. JL23]MBN3878068.1 hypothetical protein [Nostoc sp. JL23]
MRQAGGAGGEMEAGEEFYLKSLSEQYCSQPQQPSSSEAPSFSRRLHWARSTPEAGERGAGSSGEVVTDLDTPTNPERPL